MMVSDRKKAPPRISIASPMAERRKRWGQTLQQKFAVTETADRASMERSLANLKPAILLLDLDLLQLRKGDSLRDIQQLAPSTKIVLLTGAPSEAEAMSMLLAGARGYAYNILTPDLLTEVMEVVQRGELWVERKLISQLLEDFLSHAEHRQNESPAHPDQRLDCLTPREREIARLISDGACNKEVANQLHISEKTVKAHLTKVFDKLKISDRLRLALFVHDYPHLTAL